VPRRYTPPSCGPFFLEDLLDLIVGCKTTFACGLQAPIDTFQFFRRGVIYACAKTRVDLKRYLREFDLSSFRPILDTPQCILQNLGCHGDNIARRSSHLKGRAHPSATASLHGWNTSVAPLLVAPSRSTMLGQANFIGRVWTRASS
jgi:hypothetical protein